MRAWIAAGAMVVTNCCSVERAPQPRHLRAVRDKRILMVYGVGGYRFSDFGANRRAARPAGDGADGRHRTHRFPVLMWRICHSDRRTGAAARRIARETDRRPVAPPKSVEGERVISSLYLRRAVSAGDRDSTND